MNRKWVFLIIYAGLSFFYFGHLRRAGVFHWDAAYFSNEAESGWQILKRTNDFLAHRKSLEQLKTEVQASGGGVFPTGIAKPTFIWLLTLFHPFTFLRGIYVTALTALFGYALIGLVFWAGTTFESMEAGAFSAIILGLSPLYIYISRSGFSNVVAAFFLLAAIIFISRNWVFWGGLVLGLSYSCHYGILPQLLVLLACLMAYHYFRRTPLKEFGNIMAKLFSGFIAILIFWEFSYTLIEVRLGPQLTHTEFHTYFYMILHQLFWSLPLSSSVRFHFQLSFFPKLLVLGQGLLYLLFLLIAIGYSTKHSLSEKKTQGIFLIWGQGVMASLLWLFTPGIVATRVLAFLLPFYALLIGSFISKLKNQIMRWMLFALLMVSFFPLLRRSINQQSGYQAGAYFIRGNAKERIFAPSSGAQLRMLLGPGSVWNASSPLTLAKVYSEVSAGRIRYALFDYRDFLAQDDDLKAIVAQIRKEFIPLSIIPNSMACDPVNVYDLIDIRNSAWKKEGCSIEIYDLRGARKSSVM